MNHFALVRDVVKATGLSYPGVLNHINKGNLLATKVGQTFLIAVGDFRSFVEARATGKFTRQYKSASKAGVKP